MREAMLAKGSVRTPRAPRTSCRVQPGGLRRPEEIPAADFVGWPMRSASVAAGCHINSHSREHAQRWDGVARPTLSLHRNMQRDSGKLGVETHNS